ncbi:MAG: MerR family transcriptional regulator [Alphaproteobacteria bacterium]|uniref:MerR family transcriptional regulator n=1 Tax=Candidatus Nitrobium versatile TaxID=2884831 RepID=A0A953JB12_9BACT|nr:MerR family transcriptional regulator [Candidatus Nitrobium versatile]
MRKNGKLYSIKEVSEITGVPSYTLRFWERSLDGYLSPVRTEGGHRRYDGQTVETIQKIKNFVYERGYTLSGALNELKGKESGRGRKRKKMEVEMLVDEIAELLKERILKDVR